MKFLIEFTQQNLAKFRSFIRLCNKTFSKSGIIMTISKDNRIRVAPDPFSISDKFQRDYFETKVIEIYKYLAFIDYPLIPPIPPLKNSTYHSLDLKITEKYNKNNNNILIQEDDYLNKGIVVTFRISREELNKLDDLLRTNFIYSDHLTIKATSKPDFMNVEESKNYSNAFLSIFDKHTNAIKSGILFKPLKVPYSIRDYEEEFDNEENDGDKGSHYDSNLGNFLFGNYIKSKIFKKYCIMANKNVNKNLIMYIFKQRDLKEKADKNNLIISYLNNSFYIGYYLKTYLTNEDINNANLEEFKKIYKIVLNSDILLKMLKNFKNEDNNPDHLEVWTRALIMKTNYFMNNNDDENENNNKNNNIFNNDEEENSYEKDQNSEDGEPTLKYMTLKTIFYYSNDLEVIDYFGKDDENCMIEKQDVLDLIDNNIDEKHEELNKSLDLNYNENDIYRGDEDNLFFEEEEENDLSNKEDDYEEEKEKVNKKKKNKTNKIKKKEKVKKKNKEEK